MKHLCALGLLGLVLLAVAGNAAASGPSVIRLEGDIQVHIGETYDADSDVVEAELPLLEPLSLELEVLAEQLQSSSQAYSRVTAFADEDSGWVSVRLGCSAVNDDHLHAYALTGYGVDLWSLTFTPENDSLLLVEWTESGMNVELDVSQGAARVGYPSGAFERELTAGERVVMTLDMFAGPNFSGSGINGLSLSAEADLTWQVVPEPASDLCSLAALACSGWLARARSRRG